jgi:SPFH domain / Band 7 family
MNIVQNILDFLKSLLTWWFIVEPWEQAVRVRFGKNVKLFTAGAHIRIPFFDNVYVQNTRRRLISIGSQALTTNDRKVLTIHSTLGYVIADVLKLQRGLHDADGTVIQHVTACIAKDVASHDLTECGPAAIAGRVEEQLDLSDYGLDVVEFALTSYVADVQTIRLLNDNAAPYMTYQTLTTLLTDSNNAARVGR